MDKKRPCVTLIQTLGFSYWMGQLSIEIQVSIYKHLCSDYPLAMCLKWEFITLTLKPAYINLTEMESTLIKELNKVLFAYNTTL